MPEDLRPIMRTTLAAMLGAVPLVIGFGEDAELRQPHGNSILSQVMTLRGTTANGPARQSAAS